MNPIIQKAVEEFKTKFVSPSSGIEVIDLNNKKYIFGTMEDAESFLIRTLISAINNTVLQVEEMVEAKRLSRIRGIGVAEWDAHNLKARIIDEVIDGLRSSLDKLKV